MLQSYFSTRGIVTDPFKLTSSGLRTDVISKLREREEEAKKAVEPEKSFTDVLLKAMDDVNNLQNVPYQMTEQMLTDPDSVDVHDITLASAKATLALSMTKEFIERVIRAYKEIINIR